ncbi:hypothetical protein Hanom_Chr00s000008g01616441 [Helianthus anomalus]
MKILQKRLNFWAIKRWGIENRLDDCFILMSCRRGRISCMEAKY